MPNRVLVFAAHPDDDLIGCGGSLAKHVKLGNHVSVCYVTSGEEGSLEHSKEELARIREDEAKKAAEIIGFTDIIFLRNRDGYLEYNEPNLKQLVELIRKKQPHVVYVHHHLDAHEDHKVTSRLVNEAIGRAGAPIFQEYKGEPWSVETVLAYEVLDATIQVQLCRRYLRICEHQNCRSEKASIADQNHPLRRSNRRPSEVQGSDDWNGKVLRSFCSEQGHTPVLDCHLLCACAR
jgi:LmbE family N-acetylglucosaminyl deacetylase